jgi:hypothetical protein
MYLCANGIDFASFFFFCILELFRQCCVIFLFFFYSNQSNTSKICAGTILMRIVSCSQTAFISRFKPYRLPYILNLIYK